MSVTWFGGKKERPRTAGPEVVVDRVRWTDDSVEHEAEVARLHQQIRRAVADIRATGHGGDWTALPADIEESGS